MDLLSSHAHVEGVGGVPTTGQSYTELLGTDGGQLSVRLTQHAALAPSLVHCTMMIMIIMMIIII
jgi:hypothetical protein